MLRITRWLSLASSGVALAACGSDLLAPRHSRNDAGASAARATDAGGLAAYPVSGARIDLYWTDNARNESGWEVHRSTGPAAEFSLVDKTATNVTEYASTGLAPHTEYCYKVRSFRNSGPNVSYGAFSTVACAKTYGPPAPPSNMSVVPLFSNAVEASWSDYSSDEQKFRLERAGDAAGPWQAVATLAANVTTYTEYDRTPDALLCYRVIAIGQYGESSSNVDCTAVPKIPTGVAATTGAGVSIDVSWTDASAVEDGYELQRALNEDGVTSTWTVIATLAANATAYNDAAVAIDTRYSYRLRAMRDGGHSSHSAQASAFATTGPPPASTNLVAAPSGSTGAWVYWNPPVTATSFRVERSADSQGTWVTAGTSSTNGFADVNRASEQQVCYRVFAVNSFGESPASSADCTTPPARPTNLLVTSQDDGSVVVTWTDNTSVEEWYHVFVIVCYYDPYTGEIEYCEYEDRQLERDATQYTLASYELLDCVAAFSDGGWSDCAVSGSASAISGAASRMLRAPGAARGGRVSPPGAAARASRVTDRLLGAITPR